MNTIPVNVVVYGSDEGAGLTIKEILKRNESRPDKLKINEISRHLGHIKTIKDFGDPMLVPNNKTYNNATAIINKLGLKTVKPIMQPKLILEWTMTDPERYPALIDGFIEQAHKQPRKDGAILIRDLSGGKNVGNNAVEMSPVNNDWQAGIKFNFKAGLPGMKFPNLKPLEKPKMSVPTVVGSVTHIDRDWKVYTKLKTILETGKYPEIEGKTREEVAAMYSQLWEDLCNTYDSNYYGSGSIEMQLKRYQAVDRVHKLRLTKPFAMDQNSYNRVGRTLFPSQPAFFPIISDDTDLLNTLYDDIYSKPLFKVNLNSHAGPIFTGALSHKSKTPMNGSVLLQNSLICTNLLDMIRMKIDQSQYDYLGLSVLKGKPEVYPRDKGYIRNYGEHNAGAMRPAMIFYNLTQTNFLPISKESDNVVYSGTSMFRGGLTEMINNWKDICDVKDIAFGVYSDNLTIVGKHQNRYFLVSLDGSKFEAQITKPLIIAEWKRLIEDFNYINDPEEIERFFDYFQDNEHATKFMKAKNFKGDISEWKELLEDEWLIYEAFLRHYDRDVELNVDNIKFIMSKARKLPQHWEDYMLTIFPHWATDAPRILRDVQLPGNSMSSGVPGTFRWNSVLMLTIVAEMMRHLKTRQLSGVSKYVPPGVKKPVETGSRYDNKNSILEFFNVDGANVTFSPGMDTLLKNMGITLTIESSCYLEGSPNGTVLPLDMLGFNGIYYLIDGKHFYAPILAKERRHKMLIFPKSEIKERGGDWEQWLVEYCRMTAAYLMGGWSNPAETFLANRIIKSLIQQYTAKMEVATEENQHKVKEILARIFEDLEPEMVAPLKAIFDTLDAGTTLKVPSLYDVVNLIFGDVIDIGEFMTLFPNIDPSLKMPRQVLKMEGEPLGLKLKDELKGMTVDIAGKVTQFVGQRTEFGLGRLPEPRDVRVGAEYEAIHKPPMRSTAQTKGLLNAFVKSIKNKKGKLHVLVGSPPTYRFNLNVPLEQQTKVAWNNFFQNVASWLKVPIADVKAKAMEISKHFSPYLNYPPVGLKVVNIDSWLKDDDPFDCQLFYWNYTNPLYIVEKSVFDPRIDLGYYNSLGYTKEQVMSFVNDDQPFDPVNDEKLFTDIVNKRIKPMEHTKIDVAMEKTFANKSQQVEHALKNIAEEREIESELRTVSTRKTQRAERKAKAIARISESNPDRSTEAVSYLVPVYDYDQIELLKKITNETKDALVYVTALQNDPNLSQSQRNTNVGIKLSKTKDLGSSVVYIDYLMSREHTEQNKMHSKYWRLIDKMGRLINKNPKLSNFYSKLI